MKSAFSSEEIAEYYDRTKVHYQRAWDLNHSQAMHYGYTNEQVKAFRPSLANMNKQLAAYAQIQAGEQVLDAGCGVGGSSLYLANEWSCTVQGISLSEAQIQQAQKNAEDRGLKQLASFSTQDYTQTTFPDQSFDLIWALESIVHQLDRGPFLREAYRLLRPGGRIVLGEYIRSNKPMNKKEERLLKKWLDAWALSPLVRVNDYAVAAQDLGFQNLASKNITPHIRKSSWRMYYGSFFLGVLSRLYRWYNPKVSFFADNHYRGLRYQYPALRKGLWEYYFICIRK